MEQAAISWIIRFGKTTPAQTNKNDSDEKV